MSRYTIGIFLGFITSWCYAFCSIFNRRLHSISPDIVLFYHGITGMVFAFLLIAVTFLMS